MRIWTSLIGLAAAAATVIPAAAQPNAVPAAAPARVIGAKLEARPREYKGPCPVTIKFIGSIETSGPSVVKYVFDRNDSAVDTNDRHFTAAPPFHQPVETTWTLGGPGMHYAGWEQIRIVLPNAGFKSNQAAFEIWCDGAPTGGAGKPPAGVPDLTITGVSVGAVSGVSRAVQVTVKNAGTGPAVHFRMDAFQTVPRRWPLVFTVCALTVIPAGTAPCPSVWEPASLAPGASRTYSGFVTFPAGRVSGSRERVEFMADGCFAATDPALPASCRVLESNEANNTSSAEVGVP
ncbi:MAG: hypothetical protein ABI768_05265 [Acidobacteriota bacterium]